MAEDHAGELAQVQDTYLPEFQKNSPQCKFTVDRGKFIIESAWAVDDVSFVFDLKDTDLLRDINSVVFNPRFDAIFHVDVNEVEFFFAYLDPKEEPTRSYVDRRFTFAFLGDTLECCFREPSSRLFALAQRMRRLPSTATPIAPQLRAFKDAQQQDRLPEQARVFFARHVPRSFFVKMPKPVLSYDWEQLARHINFHVSYYDRKSPLIVVRCEDKPEKTTTCPARRCITGSFPTAMAAHELDDFILQLIEVAAGTSPRFAFIYYYQVIEYAGFYFVDAEARKRIRQLVTDPTMVMCPEDKISELFTVVADLRHNEDVKMCSVINEYCDPSVVWEEIENDRVFFSSPIVFDGGLQVPPLIAADMSVDTWKTMWMPKTFHQFTTVRNHLVHGRERRQSSMILPTPDNARLIERYLPVIRRIAEQIAITRVP